MTVRPERVPAEEVRQRMLAAGRELALEAGATLTIEHLRLEEVIQRARVPRSSVYRMWPYREEYIDDLLCYLAGEGSWLNGRSVIAPETADLAREIIADNAELIATVEGRRALLCEIVRVASNSSYAALTGSTMWRLHMALVATLGSTRSAQARQRVGAALEDAQRRSRESMVAVLAHLAGVLGLRLRDPAYTIHHIQLAGALVIQSLALRNVQVRAALGRDDDNPSGDNGSGGIATGDDVLTGLEASAGGAYAGVKDAAHVDALLNDPIPGPGLDGKPVMWTLAAHAYLGVIDSFMELDPDFKPSTRP